MSENLFGIIHITKHKSQNYGIAIGDVVIWQTHR